MFIGYYTELFNSPFLPYASMCALLVVLGVAMIKDGIEDAKRHKNDKKTNDLSYAKVMVDDGTFECRSWREIRVGDLICVRNKQYIPADMLFLISSDEKGAAYVETSNIDGETNLKVKSLPNIRQHGVKWSSAKDLFGVRMVLVYETPNSYIHSFLGTLRLLVNGCGILLESRKVDISIDQTNVFLRGCTLCSTDWVIGMALNTGRDTKIIQNTRAVPNKQSNMEKMTNSIMLIIFASLAAITIISAVGYVYVSRRSEDTQWSVCIHPENSPIAMLRDNCNVSNDSQNGIGIFFTFIILFNNFVPISLYVTLEFVTYVLSWYIEKDVEMYDAVHDVGAATRMSNMVGDIGQVQYLFSDKTGTLTENVMNMRRCSVGGNIYGNVNMNSAVELPPDCEQQQAKEVVPELCALAHSISSSISLGNCTPEFEFAISLALNHTLIVTRNQETGDRILHSESPDETALVEGAKLLGIEFLDRDADSVFLLYDACTGSSSSLSGTVTEEKGRCNIASPTNTSAHKYELLATIPFDSTRKRMSVIFRLPDGRCVLYCKGADNVILERAKLSYGDDIDKRTTLLYHLSLFACDGLRTLVFCKREFTSGKIENWLDEYNAAKTAPIEDRDRLLELCYESAEIELEILGVTAIEDKLQEGVSETISALHEAGTNIWVLTGDKLETAMNIGYASRMLKSNSTVICLTHKPGKEKGRVREQIQKLAVYFCSMLDGLKKQKNMKACDLYSESIKMEIPLSSVQQDYLFVVGNNSSNVLLHNHDEENWSNIEKLTSNDLALVVDGESLNEIFGYREAELAFLALAKMCYSVIACRVSPSQKRLLVRLVKKNVVPKPVTLAIGDGANDVGMLQEAQIGVGISGRESQQAANNSDFTIGQFRFLTRLLFLHGHWNYRRLCKVILYSFYKNICLTLVLFYYCFYSQFSGQTLYERLIYIGFNWFLSTPIVCVGCFDRDVSEKTALSSHKLYYTGIRQSDLNVPVTIMWLLQAVIDSLLVFYVPLFAYDHAAPTWSSRGYTDGLSVFGTLVYSCLIMVMLVKVATITSTWTSWNIGCLIGSLCFYFVFLASYTNALHFSYNFYWVAFEMQSRGIFWSLILIVPVLSWILDLIFIYVRNSYFPQTVDTEIDEEGKAAIGKGGVVVPSLSAQLAQGSDDMDKKLMVTGEYIRSYSEMLSKEYIAELGFQSSSRVNPRSSFAFDSVSNNYGGDDDMYMDEAWGILSQERSRNRSREGHNKGSRFRRFTLKPLYNSPEPISSSRLRKCLSLPGAKSSTRTRESTSKCTDPDR